MTATVASRQRARTPGSQDLDGELPPHRSNGHAAKPVRAFGSDPDEAQLDDSDPQQPSEPRPRRPGKTTANEQEDSTGDGSLDELAEKINALYGRLLRHNRRANEAALEIGLLLLKAKQRLPHGSFGHWVERHLSVGARQSQRYLRLAQNRERLDQIQPGWHQQLTLTEALELLADPLAEPERWPTAPARRPREEGFGDPPVTARAAVDKPAIKPAVDAKTPAQLVKEAKARHREWLQQAPRVLAMMDFGRGGREAVALRELGESLLVAAYRAAEWSYERFFKSQGFACEAVAMALVTQFLKQTRTRELFAPTPDDILEDAGLDGTVEPAAA